MANYLELTDAQKEQAKAIFQDARAQSKPVADQLRQLRQGAKAAVKEGRSEAELEQIAQRTGPLVSQLAANHLKAMAKFRAILTPEQVDKLDKIPERGPRGRFGRGPGAAERPEL
jgi:Spy/CpxP family protein refolding chaperone